MLCYDASEHYSQFGLTVTPSVTMSGYRVDAKLVVLGDQFCGKTSLVERYLHGHFSGETLPYQNTIGAAYGARRLEV